MRWFALLVSILLCPWWLQAQEEEQASSDFFASINAGLGMPYGGFGLQAEIGKEHIAAFAAFGHATAVRDIPVTIPATWNWQVGTRYYFNVGSEMIYPRAGFAVGWITNYYHDLIGAAVYNPSVYGPSAQLGLQIVSVHGIVVNLDAAMAAEAFIFDRPSHPHFYDFYIRPSVGIGYEISRLSLARKKKDLLNKEINPFE